MYIFVRIKELNPCIEVTSRHRISIRGSHQPLPYAGSNLRHVSHSAFGVVTSTSRLTVPSSWSRNLNFRTLSFSSPSRAIVVRDNVSSIIRCYLIFMLYFFIKLSYIFLILVLVGNKYIWPINLLSTQSIWFLLPYLYGMPRNASPTLDEFYNIDCFHYIFYILY